MKIVLSLVLGFLVISMAWAEELKVDVEELTFTQGTYPGLEVLSVYELSSDDDRFGGLSGLVLKGETLISVSDKGKLFQFDLNDLSKIEVFSLRTKKGKPYKGKRQSDAESIAHGPDGTLYIAFERDHRVVPFNVMGSALGKKVKLPKGISKLKKNSGFEGIETLPDGTLVLLGEGKAEAPLWIKPKNAKWQKRDLALSGGFRPTGLTYVAGHASLIMMERFYMPLVGVRIRLSWLDVKTGLRGAEIAELTSPLPMDNMEGITSYQNTAGDDILLLISDDNFSPLQRTLLMKARLK